MTDEDYRTALNGAHFAKRQITFAGVELVHIQERVEEGIRSETRDQLTNLQSTLRMALKEATTLVRLMEEETQ